MPLGNREGERRTPGARRPLPSRHHVTLGGGHGGALRPAIRRSPPIASPGMGGFISGTLGHLRFAFVALLAACATPRSSGPIVVAGDAGDTVRLAAPATRVASLQPTTTELLFAVGAGDRVVGRT